MNRSQDHAADKALLRAANLGREVPGKVIIRDVSFTVKTGELLGMVGASGSGKSSLLRLLNRLDEPTGGTVYVDDHDYRLLPPTELRRRVGMVTQRPYLFPGDVASNLRFGPQQRGETVPDDEIALLLQRIDLPGLAAQDVSVLSGGEQQRVSLARTLANRPEILLLDEPTSALDERSARGIEGLVNAVVRDQGLTCVMVTHDRGQAKRLCDRVALLEAGRLVQIGSVVEVLGA